MKKFAVIMGVCALVSTTGSAQAQNWYAGGYGAMNYAHDGTANGNENVDYNLGYGIGGFVGYAMASGFRLEGELAYRVNEIDSVGGAPYGGDLSTFAAMGNALYEFNVQSSIKPHIGGGLGLVFGTIDFGGVEYDDTELAAQFIVGADYKVSPDLAIVIDYRHLISGDFGFGAGAGLGGLEYSNSTVSAGLRKMF